MFALQLKAHYPYSYISSFTEKSLEIRTKLGKEDKNGNIIPKSKTSFNRNIQELIEYKLAYFEGTTLRILSNTEIRERYATSYRGKNRFIQVYPNGIERGVDILLLEQNTNKQIGAIRCKKKQRPQPEEGCQSFQNLKQVAPQAVYANNIETVLSQRKAASLLGYKSAVSGFKRMRELQSDGLLQILPNMIELDREDYLRRMKVSSQVRFLLKRKESGTCKYYYCLPNTVNVINYFRFRSYQKRFDANRKFSYVINDFFWDCF